MGLAHWLTPKLFTFTDSHSLLDASGNDGDRGALVVTFAEALVVEGNPHSYVNLLDHLAEDFETMFEGMQDQFSSHLCPSFRLKSSLTSDN